MKTVTFIIVIMAVATIVTSCSESNHPLTLGVERSLTPAKQPPVMQPPGQGLPSCGPIQGPYQINQGGFNAWTGPVGIAYITNASGEIIKLTPTPGVWRDYISMYVSSVHEPFIIINFMQADLIGVTYTTGGFCDPTQSDCSQPIPPNISRLDYEATCASAIVVTVNM